MIDQIVIAPVPATDNYAFHLYPDEYKPDQIAVFQINTGYFFPVYDSENKCYTFLLTPEEKFVPRTGSIQVRGILYNYNSESSADVRTGFTDLSLIDPIEFVALAPGVSVQSSDWRPSGLVVSKIEGPFQDDKLVTEIDLTKKVYYLATPSTQDISDSQMLCIKWQYQYNADPVKSFKNSIRSVVTIDNVRKCKMLCEFNNQTSTRTIQIYPFMNERDSKLFSTCLVKGASNLTDIKVCRISLKEIEDVFGIYSKQKAFRQEIIDLLNKYIYDSGNEIHINTKLRKAHFFAQVGAETLGIHPDWIVENDGNYYKPAVVRTKFGDRAKKLEAQGKLIMYLDQRPQIKFLNYVYAEENGFGNGNGDEQSGDGYRYRGRGLFQTTGRGNYRSAAERVKELFPDDYVDYEAYPEKLKEPKHAVLSAIAFWEKKKIWELADKLPNPTEDEFKTIRKMVNTGLSDWKKAHEHMLLGMTVFEEKCKEKSGISSNPESAATDTSPGTFNAKDIVTFRVYSTGAIEKHIPKEISAANKNKYKYIYVDSKNIEHEMKILTKSTADTRLPAFKKNDPGKVKPGWKTTYNYPTGGAAQKAYVYENGDIIATGNGWTPRLYGKGSGTVELVKMEELSHNKNGIRICFSFSGTQRRYCNPGTYAALIGMLAETGRTDNISTGFCFSDATCFPSREHPNGDCADFTYLSSKDLKDPVKIEAALKLEQPRVNAAMKFQFKDIITGKNNWTAKITGKQVSHQGDHDDHLHLGEFDVNSVVVINEK